MAPSTLGTFLRLFTFGHVRQLDKVIAETTRRAWAAGAGPGDEAMTIDMDSTMRIASAPARYPVLRRLPQGPASYLGAFA